MPPAQANGRENGRDHGWDNGRKDDWEHGRGHDHEPPTGELPIEAYQPPPAPKPPTYRPGHAPLPQPPPARQQPDYQQTAAYEPSDYRQSGYQPAGHERTGYAQTGYPPLSYQPPGYPPGPPSYPPQPPRRSNIPLIALVVAVALLLCAGGITATVLATRTVANRAKEIAAPILEPTKPVVPTALPTLPTSLPDIPGIPGLPGSGKKITVVYEVTGAGPAEIFYAEKLGDSPVHIKDAKLPWRKTVTMDGGTLLFVSATRTSLKDGSITCRVTSDGAEVAKTQHDGAFATAACTKLIVF